MSILLTPEEARGFVESDSAGVAALPPGSSDDQILFAKDGFLPLVVTRSAIRPEEASGLARLRMERGKSLEILVVDPAGQPIAGARVEARRLFGEALSIAGLAAAGPRSAADLRSGITADDGRVTITGIPAFPVSVAVSKHDHTGIEQPPVSESGESIRVTLAPLLRIGLDVKDAETGLPIATAHATVLDYGAFQPVEYTRQSRRTTTPSAGWTSGHTTHWSTWIPNDIRSRARRGEASPTVDETDGVVFEVSALGYGSRGLRVVPARPNDDGSLAPVSLLLAREANAREVSMVVVRVECPPAEPPRWVTLDVTRVGDGQTPEHGRQITVSLSPLGRCEIPFPLGIYRVALLGFGTPWWTGPVAQTQEFVVRPGAELALRIPCARLRARITDERGAALPGFMATLSGAPSKRGSVASMAFVRGDDFAGGDTWSAPPEGRPPGTIELLLSPGLHGISFAHAGFEARSETFDLAEGEDRTLDVRLVERK